MERSRKRLRAAAIAGTVACVAWADMTAPGMAQQASDRPQVIPAASHGGHQGGGHGAGHSGGQKHPPSGHRGHRTWSDHRYSGWHDDWRRPDWRYGSIYRHRDFDHWRRGYWYYGPHYGRYGWWWTLDDEWYAYQVPIYPYPDPDTAPPPVYYDPSMVQPPAPPPPAAPPGQPPMVYDPYTNQYKPQGPATSYYYCYSPPGYYPDVTECPSGWVARPPG